MQSILLGKNMKGTAAQPFYYAGIASSPFEVCGVQAWQDTREQTKNNTE